MRANAPVSKLFESFDEYKFFTEYLKDLTPLKYRSKAVFELGDVHPNTLWLSFRYVDKPGLTDILTALNCSSADFTWHLNGEAVQFKPRWIASQLENFREIRSTTDRYMICATIEDITYDGNVTKITEYKVGHKTELVSYTTITPLPKTSCSARFFGSASSNSSGIKTIGRTDDTSLTKAIVNSCRLL